MKLEIQKFRITLLSRGFLDRLYKITTACLVALAAGLPRPAASQGYPPAGAYGMPPMPGYGMPMPYYPPIHPIGPDRTIADWAAMASQAAAMASQAAIMPPPMPMHRGVSIVQPRPALPPSGRHGVLSPWPPK